jgi:ankyrin repeat protein
VACWFGREAVVKELINEYGANPEAQASNHSRPIHACAQQGNDKALQLLVAANVDLEATDQSWNTPLHHAAKQGHLTLVQTLCKALRDTGADLEVTDEEGETALHIACHRGDLEMVKELLKAGANPAATVDDNWDWNWSTPFAIACNTNKDDVAHALLDAGLRNEVAGEWPRDVTLLHLACHLGRPAIVERLIREGANVNAVCVWNDLNLHPDEHDNECTPLYDVARASLPDGPTIIQMLVAAGADPNKAGERGGTPLEEAAGSGHLETVKALVECGAEVNQRIARGRTALYDAIGEDYNNKTPEEVAKHEAVVKYLLEAGAKAEINTQDDNLETPLHQACRLSLDTVSLVLLEHGARLDLANHEGKTPLDLAKESGNRNLIRMLEMVQAREKAAKAKEESGASAGAGGAK